MRAFSTEATSQTSWLISAASGHGIRKPTQSQPESSKLQAQFNKRKTLEFLVAGEFIFLLSRFDFE